MDQPIEVLVISSELEHRRALVDILNREQWDTICASTVNECEELFARRDVALVFCERELPDGTYRDVLRTIRSLNTNVPLVVTSRLADWDEYLEALQEGAFDLIASPCRSTDVTWVMLRAQREGKKRAAFIHRDKTDKDMSFHEPIRAER
jgi:DNA-binding NtrC family response regulator